MCRRLRYGVRARGHDNRPVRKRHISGRLHRDAYRLHDLVNTSDLLVRDELERIRYLGSRWVLMKPRPTMVQLAE